MKYQICVLLACIFTLAGCGKQAPNTSETSSTKATTPPIAAAPLKLREVKGEIFVTQRNGQSVKMGSVNVSIYPTSVAREHLEKLRARFTGELEKREAEMVVILTQLVSNKTEIVRLNAEKSTTETARETAYVRATQMAADRQVQAGNPIKVEEYRKLKAAYDDLTARLTNINGAIKTQNNELREAQEREKKVKDYQFTIFARDADWPRPATETVSNADGIFTLSVPESTNYTAVAFSSRALALGTSTEHYLWVADIGNADRVQLGNNAIDQTDTEQLKRNR